MKHTLLRPLVTLLVLLAAGLAVCCGYLYAAAAMTDRAVVRLNAEAAHVKRETAARVKAAAVMTAARVVAAAVVSATVATRTIAVATSTKAIL